MTFLLDTNVFLEILLGQERAEEAGQLLLRSPSQTLHLSDFTLFSIGIKLFGVGAPHRFVDFVNDVVVRGVADIATMPAEAFAEIADAAASFNLDFDDAYQYALAQRLEAVIVSFDADFDRTERGRTTPNEALAAMNIE